MTHKFKINYESNLFAGGNQLTTTPTPTPTTSKHIFNFYDQEDYPNKISSDSVSDNKIITSLDVQTRTYILENFLYF